MAYNAPEKPSGAFVTIPLAADAVIEAGQLVARNAAGNAVAASDTAALQVIGRAEADADNTGGAIGDVSILVKRGTFQYDNDGDDPVSKADVGRVCYIVDAVTVSDDPQTHGRVAGRVVEVDSDGVWVDTFTTGPVATAPTLTSTNGTAAAAADLAALKAEAENIGDDVRAIHAALRAAGILI
jgi:hypothetical protein